MAKEYIEKEAFCLMLYNRGMRLLDEDKEPVLAGTLHAVEKMAHDFPAADVRENVKGEWIDKEIFPAKGNVDMLQSALCPKCGRYHTTPYSYYFTNYEFCPRCGAKMGGAEDG
jgi:ribosomal protein S27AE